MRAETVVCPRPPHAGGAGNTASATVTVGATLDSGLVAYYPFEGNANDISGNGNNGIAYGGVNYTTSGVSGQAAAFDGVNDYIQFNQSASLDSLTENITLSFWIKSGSTSFHGSIPICKRFSSNEGMHFCVALDSQYGVSFQTSGESAPYPSYSVVAPKDNIFSAISDDEWHQLILQHQWGSASNTRIFLDG